MRKTFLIIILTILVLIITALSTLYFFKDKIVKVTIEQLNNLLTTQVAINDNISVTFWEHFPNISVGFHQVRIFENIKTSDNDTLAKAEDLSFTFDAIDLWNGTYTFDNIYIKNGFLKVKINSAGKRNFDVIKKDSLQNTSTDFKLEKIVLDNFQVVYSNAITQQVYDVNFTHGTTKIAFIDNKYLIDIQSIILINNILVQGNEFFKYKETLIQSSISYDLGTETVVIKPSTLKVENANFNFAGNIETKHKKSLNLSIKEENGTIQTLLSLLPRSFYNEVRDYESTGKIYFKAHISGIINRSTNPFVEVNFGFKDATIYHPKLKKQVTKARLTGYFTNGLKRHASSFRLDLKDISCSMEGKTFTGHLSMYNFQDPTIDAAVKGGIDAELLQGFYPVPGVKMMKGNLLFNVLMAGRIKDLAENNTANKVQASGEIELNDFTILGENSPLAFEHIKGQFLFNRNDLSVNNLSGKIGKSDFNINGFFKNVISKLVYNKQSLFIEADISSNYLDLNEILLLWKDYEKTDLPAQVNYTTSEKAKPKNSYSDAYLLLECKMKALKYDRITATEVIARINYTNQRTSITEASLAIAGGSLIFDAYFNTLPTSEVEAHCFAKSKDCQVDSLFYMMRNFDQDFITDKNIKGLLTGSIDAYCHLHPSFDIKLPTLTANIEASIYKGELNNFQPMKKLSKFIKEEKLENILFSELSNRFYIEKEVISIPEMEIKSSASNLTISGTHTFSHNMDYRVTVPLNNFRKAKRDKDEAYGAIEEDHKGNPNLFLTIKGTSENYKIAYDNKRTTIKIKEDLKKEKEELKGLFRKKKVKEQIIEEQQEQEYFNFDQ